MLSLVYRKSVPRYLLMRAGAKRIKNLETGRFSPLQLEDAPEPELPTPEWIRVKPLLSGICGSDLGTLSSDNSPYFSPITSPPFVMGHEVVGVVTDDNSGFRAGERVVLEPALGCAVRGLDPPCPYCASGRHALCLNVAKGDVSPGIQTGFCRDTGGGWTQRTLVAHPSQLHRVPEDLSDEATVALEPLACAVHAALKTNPGPDDTTLVIGAGNIGLFTVAALRRLTDAGRIICVAKHERQREEALRLGADEIVHPKRQAGRHGWRREGLRVCGICGHDRGRPAPDEAWRQSLPRRDARSQEQPGSHRALAQGGNPLRRLRLRGRGV
jgi:threonine dehydrogenase-like Zn-dependent dehydrogenase